MQMATDPLHCVSDVTITLTLFDVNVTERQDKLPTMYWLPKLHKRPYKARLIANSSSCTTPELSKLLFLSNRVSFGTMRQCMKGQGKIGKICFGL